MEWAVKYFNNNTFKIPWRWWVATWLLVALFVPVFKAGERGLLNNYCRISLTCTPCKLLQYIVYRHLIPFFEQNGILYSMRHQFRSNVSRFTQLVECLSDFSSAVNDKNHVDAIFLDLSIAFHRVSHIEFLNILASLGVNSTLLKWMGAYLSNHGQFMNVDGSFS